MSPRAVDVLLVALLAALLALGVAVCPLDDRGDRVAQLVFLPCPQAAFVLSDTLSDTLRADGGFGSTNK